MTYLDSNHIKRIENEDWIKGICYEQEVLKLIIPSNVVKALPDYPI